MKIIASHLLQVQALKKLSRLGEVIILHDQPGVYKSIASHPDIHFCQIGDVMITSPAFSSEFMRRLSNLKVILGNTVPSGEYPATACYNALVVNNIFIHHLKATDPVILKYVESMHPIHVNQAYTRCNLIGLDSQNFITSDHGIEKALLAEGKRVLFINLKQIILDHQLHGFFGGTCGVYDHVIYLNGSLDHLDEADEFIDFISNCGYHAVELNRGALADVGSILFVEEDG